MPITPAADGHGAVVTFAGFLAHLIGVNGPSLARDAIETTHMGTTGAKTYTPADLVDAGELSLEVEFDPQAVPPIDGPAGELELVWGTVPAITWTWQDAFMTGFQIGGAKTGERMTATVVFKLSSLPTVS